MCIFAAKLLNCNYMNKVILFARVSTQHQTLESQIDELRLEAKRLGYSDEAMQVIDFKESAVKLDIEERQGIQALKTAITNDNTIDCVIVYEISRISRRPKMLYEVRDWLIERNIQLCCLRPYMRLLEDGKLSQTASILFSLFGSMAESEGFIRKERMQRGKKHKQSLGGYIGGKPLFGYTFINDKLCIDARESEIVKKMFDMYETGLSSRSIAIELMQTGELKQDKIHNATQLVINIIARCEYCGEHSSTSNYNYPAIITKAQFYRCRDIAANKRKEHSKVKKICLLKGMIRSAENGYVLSPNIAKNQYKLYTLDNPTNMTLRIDLMDTLAWDVMREYSKTREDKENEKIVLSLRQESSVLERKVQQAMRNINSIRSQIDRIETRIIEGKMSEIKGDKMIEEKMKEMEIQQNIFDTNNYLFAKKQEMLYEGKFKRDIDTILTDEEKQEYIRQKLDKVIAQKTYEKRGHYFLDFIMKDGTVYKYKFWSSGPWNKIERIG